ncbi:lauroyl acyltransferase [Maritimibacter sp. 55A14]|uniref:lysophospholipid acyltransferase family protein n=1 Tax=Maritimibacter sp. 55A14 TaxID=2174844 RepID=UPI000D607A54|nr:lysophospholipid acyltransferase family protein [Maritimibacter sp. 55A14]PWE34401.1 lauroyl acyltransferase [Maritimibacter sp. 55A14]
MAGTFKSMTDRLSDLAIRGLIRAAFLLPYRWRVPAVGWLTGQILAPLVGWRARIRANLAHVLPDLPRAEVRRLCREVPDNAGRTFIEFYSVEEFHDRMRRAPLVGPGLAVFDAAKAEGRPVVMISGHFANYQAINVAINLHGEQIGVLYRPMNNPYFNKHYVETTRRIAEPIFPRDKRGMAQLIRHLRGGGNVGILIDQFFRNGAALDFFGKPAPTALSAAELALKTDALLLPAFAIRQENGLDFIVEMEEPIPHSDAETMTQDFNRRLEARVRAHMGQWLWIHRRWKPELQRRRAAASIGP